MIDLVVLVSRGLLRNQTTRRHLMFYVIIVAMLMLFLGATFLREWLLGQVLLLVAYWFACGGLTIFAALLAVFDILILRAEARAERRRMEQEVLDAARAKLAREEGQG